MSPTDRKETPFFVGYLSPPKALLPFLIAVAAFVTALFAGVSYLMAAGQWDPGDGAFRWDWAPSSATGVMTIHPYPMVHVIESDRYEPGTTLLLSGGGKIGVQSRAQDLDGRLVRVTGVPLNRGDVDMLQLRGGTRGLEAVDGAVDGAVQGAVPAVPTTPLGRWRLTGEICDGKCYTGAMRPGTGLAHKACANLCLIGGVPAIFVSTAPVDGDIFLVMASADGRDMTDALLDHVATLVTVEGTVERIGGALVLKADLGTLSVVE